MFYIVFQGYFNVSRIVQAHLKDVSYFYRCFQVFLAQTMRLTWEFCYLLLALCGMLSEICYWKFAIYVFFWDLQLLARKLLSFATIVRLAIFFLNWSNSLKHEIKQYKLLFNYDPPSLAPVKGAQVPKVGRCQRRWSQKPKFVVCFFWSLPI